MILPMPMVSQLTTITGDGRPDKNAEFCCVEASVMAAILCLRKLPGWTAQYNPDRLLDLAYPEGYVGGTDIHKLTEAVRHFGATITQQVGTAKQLVGFVHKQLQAGHPVVFTEPDPYLEGWWHCCVFYGESDGGLLAMDPYIARAVQKSDSGWASTIVSDQGVWVVELIPEAPAPATHAHEYMVKPGDNLSDVASQHGISFAELLSKNQKVLDEAAQKYGYRNCEEGNLIFPGTVLTW